MRWVILPALPAMEHRNQNERGFQRIWAASLGIVRRLFRKDSLATRFETQFLFHKSQKVEGMSALYLTFISIHQLQLWILQMIQYSHYRCHQYLIYTWDILELELWKSGWTLGTWQRFQAELLIPCGNKLGECPVWDDARVLAGCVSFQPAQGKMEREHPF